MVIVRDDVVVKYTLYNKILERFSIGWDRRVFLRVVCRAVARSGISGVPRGASPLAGPAGYPGVPTISSLLGGWGKEDFAIALGLFEEEVAL